MDSCNITSGQGLANCLLPNPATSVQDIVRILRATIGKEISRNGEDP